jgi:hypothetical protein
MQTLQHPLETTVRTLSHRLVEQVGKHISDRLTAYMALPQQLIQMNAEMIAAGQIDVNNPVLGEQHLWRQARLFENISYIGYALTDGHRESGAGRWIDGKLAVYENRNGRGFDYAADPQGGRAHLIQSYDYDPFSQSCHQQAMAAGKAIWTDIYTVEIENIDIAIAADPADATSNVGYQNYVAINAERPLLNAQGEIFGLSIVDVLLEDISLFLKELKPSPAGQVFIMERNGLLIGSSEPQSILHKVEEQAERFSALTIPDLMIRSVSEALLEKFKSFEAIESSQRLDFACDDQRYLVSVMPWQDAYGLDWLVVVSVPESDLLAS